MAMDLGTSSANGIARAVRAGTITAAGAVGAAFAAIRVREPVLNALPGVPEERGRAGRGRMGAAAPRLAPNGFVPGPRLALWHLRAQAHLWPAVAWPQLSVRCEPRPCRPARLHSGRPRTRL